MIELSAAQIADVVGGSLFAEPDLLVTSSPIIDSRDATSGSLFLAFKGEKVDGHEFVSDAVARGASLVLASRSVEVPHVLVEDVSEALAKLATYVRTQLSDLVVIGITGSQGKTTTKDLLAHVLGLVGETVSARGSLNNDLGAPLTLLKCTRSTRFCVVEMGARHVGDIDRLCRIVRPNIGVVLTVGSAHLGEFGSVENIAIAKSELVRSLSHEGVAILGQYDSYTSKMANGLQARVMKFGEHHEDDVRATDIDIREGRAHFDLVTPEGREPVALRLAGEHQIPNALAVASVCTALDIPLDVIAGGLSTAEISSRWRMEISEVSEMVFINDSYNANPESMRAALRSLAFFAQERGGQSWAFLGKMHELGETSVAQHADIGIYAGKLGIDHLVCVGAPEYSTEMAEYPETQVHVFSTKLEASTLVNFFSHGDVALIKGSRAEQMEDLAELVMTNWSERAIEAT
jgi:UDP-N-acetylmuramoyl-tripeptide--D-alanyl-D-alanine ligase